MCKEFGHIAQDCADNARYHHKKRYVEPRENRIRVMDSLKSVKFDKWSDGTDNYNVSLKITRTLLVSGKRVEFLLDTGSEVSTLSEATAEKLNIKLKEPDKHIRGVDKSLVNVLSRAKICIGDFNRFVDTKIYVLANSNENLLGIADITR